MKIKPKKPDALDRAIAMAELLASYSGARKLIVDQLRAAKREAGLLDWLEAHPYSLRGGDGCWSTYPHQMKPVKTARAAIRAAMKKGAKHGE